jgi:hypothetical protein
MINLLNCVLIISSCYHNIKLNIYIYIYNYVNIIIFDLLNTFYILLICLNIIIPNSNIVIIFYARN